MNDVISQPIFKPLKDRFKPLGVALPRMFLIIGVTIFGAILAVCLGAFKHEVKVPYTDAERTVILTDYINNQSTITSLDMQRQQRGLESVSELDLTQDQIKAIEYAKEHGIRIGMSEEELASLVPVDHYAEQEYVHIAVRLLLLCGVPLAVGFGLFVELDGVCFYGIQKRRLAWKRTQKIYRDDPIEFVERHTNKSYLDAVYD